MKTIYALVKKMLWTFSHYWVLTLISTLLVAATCTNAKAFQQQEITGTTTDIGTGEILVGTNIIVKGTTRGTVSGPSGKYKLAANPTDTLVFSFVGYEKEEVRVGERKVINIRLTAGLGFYMDQVMVTARRRIEGLQETPLSITAIQGQILEDMDAADLTGITKIAPNITFSTTGTVSGSTSAAVVYIRGIGQNDYTPVTDPGVGIYVDDIYLGRTIGSVLDLMDIKSVEVIRGPQGTLFGRNSIGGAISIKTQEPKDVAAGKFRMIAGNYGRKEYLTSLHMPLSKSVRSMVTVMRRVQDGYVERVNLPGSEALGNDNSTGARIKLNADISDKFKLQLGGDYVLEREQSAPEQNLYFRNGIEQGLGQTDRLVPRLWNSGLFTSTASGCDLSLQQNPFPGGTDCYDQRLNLGPFKTGETSLSRNNIDSWGINAVGNYEFSESLSSKLILSYRDLKAMLARQVDGSRFNLFENRELYNQNQFSADLRFNGDTKKLAYVVGVFYFAEDANNQLDFGGALNGAAWPVHFGGLVNNSNYAGYGEVTYHITSKWDATGGVRYTNEIRKVNPNAFSYPTGNIDNPPAGPGQIRNATTNPTRLIDQISQKNSFDKATWRLNTSYKMKEGINAYVAASTGFKSGGFEWRVTNANFYNDARFDYDGDGDGDLPQFKPETVTQYEVGLKTEFSKIGLRLNLAGFYSDYKDIQIAANPPGSIATFQDNAGKGTIQGFEVEGTWVPTNSLLINLGVGYIDARYTELNPGTSATLEDHFILTPKWSVSGGASYRFAFRNGSSITPRIDSNYRSETDFESQNSIYVVENGYTIWNGAIKFKDKTDAWGLSLGMNNITNETYLIGGDANTAIGYENGIYARPQSWFITFEYKF